MTGPDADQRNCLYLTDMECLHLRAGLLEAQAAIEMTLQAGGLKLTLDSTLRRHHDVLYALLERLKEIT